MTDTPESEAPPAAPDGLQASGRALWEAVVSEFDQAAHETALLLQACRTVDACDALQAALDAGGPMMDSPQGTKAHPALPELRQQRIALARLFAALGLPSGVEADGDDARKIKQRRAVRGVYDITTGKQVGS